MKKTKTNQKLLMLCVTLINIFVLSHIITCLSWFVFIRSTAAKISLGAKDYDISAEIYIDDVLSPDNNVQFNNMFPGYSYRRTLTVKLTNNDTIPLASLCFFASPGENNEIPYIDNQGIYGESGTLYYLGSQIQVYDVSYSLGGSIFESARGKGQYLVSTSSNGVSKGQVNGVSTPITNIPRLEIVDGIVLEPNQSTTISIIFVFVDNGTNQNVYQKAWPSVGVCVRELKVYITEGVG